MLRSVLTVLSGVALAQVIALAALPVLTRLYDPVAFGVYQVFASVLSVALVFASLRYEHGLLTARDGAEYRRLLALALWLCAATAALMLAGVAAAAALAPQAVAGLGAALWLLPPALLVAGALQALTYVPARHRDYPLSARAKVTQAAGTAGTSVALGLTPLGALGLIGGDLVGRALAAARILRGAPRAEGGGGWRLGWAEARATLAAHRSLPLFLLPGALLSSLVPAMIPLAFAQGYGLEAVGQYALVHRVAFLPVGVLAAALAQVLSGDLARLVREEPARAHALFRRTMGVLGLIGGALGVAVWLLAPLLIPILFGAEWALAGALCAAAAPLLVASFMAAPATMVLVLAGRTRWQLGWEIARFAALVVLFAGLLAVPGLGPVGMMAAFAAAGSLTYAAFLLLADRALARVSRAAGG